MLEPMILIINPNENNENHESSNLLRSYLRERYIVFFLVNLDFSCYIFSSYIYQTNKIVTINVYLLMFELMWTGIMPVINCPTPYVITSKKM